MKSIREKQFHTHLVQKSIFHNYLIPCKDVNDIEGLLKDIKEAHRGASHTCTAYIIGHQANIQKYNDDGEPSQTAGLPMLEVLKKNELTNVLAVSVRFFGGIKLGAGGLIRAYAKGVSNNVETASFTHLQTRVTCTLTIPFDAIGHVEHFVRKSYKLIQTDYTDKVTYTIELLEPDLAEFKNFFMNQTAGKAEIEAIASLTEFM